MPAADISEIDAAIKAHYPAGGFAAVVALFPGLSPFRVMARAIEINVRKVV